MVQQKHEAKMIYEKNSKREMTFEDVLQQYKPLCDSMVSFYFRNCNWAGLDDLKQVAYIGLWVGYVKYDPKREIGFGYYARQWVRSWVRRYINSGQFSVLRHAGLDSIYETMTEDDDGDELTIFDTLASDNNIEEIAISNAEVERIYKSIRNEKDIKIVKYLIQGWSKRKIGEKLGISGERVRQRITKIKEKLKEAAS